MDSPVGVIATVKDLLRTSLATCTAFRTWDGASYTVDQAKDRIYFDALPPPEDQNEYTAAELDVLRPYAIISKDERGIEFELESVSGSSQSFKPSGRLVVKLARNFPDVDEEADPAAAADRSFENMVGQLMKSGDPAAPGLLELSGTSGYLSIRRLSEAGPYRVDPQDATQLGDHQVHMLFVDWGRA
jgi:hypothetical protein